MNEIFEYRTINRSVKDVLLKEKGSKFIGFAFPVLDEEEIRLKLEQIRSNHTKATHHCYAYRLGTDGTKFRANDDGEPSGSAGLPIYNQLLGHQLTNVLLIVVRYYGGTKLGVSNLVKTYKETAKLTLDLSDPVCKELITVLHVRFPFEQQNSIFTILNRWQAKIINFESEENCNLTAEIKLSAKENISEILSEMHQVQFRFAN